MTKVWFNNFLTIPPYRSPALSRGPVLLESFPKSWTRLKGRGPIWNTRTPLYLILLLDGEGGPEGAEGGDPLKEKDFA